MTLAEIMKSNGMTDEVINAVLSAMKKNKIFTTGEENLDIRYGKMKADYDNLTVCCLRAQSKKWALVLQRPGH